VNNLSNPLDRLFRSAAGTSTILVMTPPDGLETRVLAAWRSSQSVPIWSAGVLTRGLAIAALLVLASCWPALEEESNADSENLQFADSSVPSELAP
jgi:hypothetical protein